MTIKSRLRRYGVRLRDLSSAHIKPRLPSVHYFLFYRLRRYLSGLNASFTEGAALDLSVLTTAGAWPGESGSPLVSVIVPAYNHEQYLGQRLECIYDQTYPNVEVILLDDCSSDGSADVLRDWAGRYPEKTRLQLNETNSGSPFGQWGVLSH
ncbi:glycosyltransferase family 2 protein [Congregibacter litoralis]|uniref:glycosyltransferase family 2 protein n=1 Tax=Congregibacter litoralis TaxID=393662 RepID=UPI00006B8505|nr:glycosyltransferase family A protein [Congregibacter litoralis]